MNDAPAMRPPKESARRRLWVARSMIVLALVLLGAGLTYLVAPPVGAPPKVVTLTPLSDAEQQGDRPAPMPSLNGLSVETVRLVLRDAGVASLDVSTRTRAAAGPPGLVLEQIPAAGTEIGNGAGLKVELTVSKPIRMPDVRSEAFQQAQSKLQQLGAIVRAVQVVRPGSKVGTVLASTPAAGATMPAVVTLEVADAGVSTALGEIGEEDSSGCYGANDVTVGATTVPSAVECDIEDGETSYIVYALTGAPLALSFTPGRDGDEGPGSGTIRVLADGKQVVLVQAGDGTKPVKRTVNISGAKRLRVEATGRSTDPDDGEVALVLANAVLQGKGEDIAALENQ